MAVRRKVITIDEDKCDGCGLCVPACAEGAIQIIDGKARLVSETYCDGLGACLGECPQGAITMEEREAAAFDEEAVQAHLASQGAPQPALRHGPMPGGCPGAAARAIERGGGGAVSSRDDGDEGATPSTLANWPVQLHLVPPHAPYLQGAKLLIAADCVPFAFPDFHRRLLDGRVLLIGCPKLDEVAAYHEKLVAMLRDNAIESVEVAYMEVPCCFGLVHLVQTALAQSGKAIPLSLVKIGIRGGVLETAAVGAGA